MCTEDGQVGITVMLVLTRLVLRKPLRIATWVAADWTNAEDAMLSRAMTMSSLSGSFSTSLIQNIVSITSKLVPQATVLEECSHTTFLIKQLMSSRTSVSSLGTRSLEELVSTKRTSKARTSWLWMEEKMEHSHQQVELTEPENGFTNQWKTPSRSLDSHKDANWTRGPTLLHHGTILFQLLEFKARIFIAWSTPAVAQEELCNACTTEITTPFQNTWLT